MNLQDLLALSIERQASDLHLSPRQPPILRIDGDLIPLKEAPVLEVDVCMKLIYSAMDRDKQKTFESALELDFAICLPSIGNFRVNVFRQLWGISAVFRIIPWQIPSLDSIGVPMVIKKLMSLSSGLILVTGSTGCGKSTTLAAMLDYINEHQACHIITIEDPIEFVHESKLGLVHQRQINRDSLSFATALRSALREDPDVILVGEMRDLETIRLAITAAETGHLVMGTLHTSSAPRAINRMIDVFPSKEKNMIRNLISESLQAVICQTLVKKTSQGRVAAFEVMLGTSAIRNLIREDKIAQMYSVMQTNTSIGMCTMQQSFNELIAKNICNSDKLCESASDYNSIKNV